MYIREIFSITSICPNEIGLLSSVNTSGVLSSGGKGWKLVAFNAQLFFPSSVQGGSNCVQRSSGPALKVGHCGVWGDGLVQE